MDMPDKKDVSSNVLAGIINPCGAKKKSMYIIACMLLGYVWT